VQLAESNSYIIHPLPGTVQTTYGVPVTRVNRFWGSPDGTAANVLSSTTGWEAEVIWQDKAGEGLIDFCESNGTILTTGKYEGTGETYFYFSPKDENASGNVLIGVKKKGAPASNGYLWSWHLWITNYDPDAAPLAWQEGVYSYNVTGGAVHRYAGATWSAAYTDKFIMDRNLGAASANRADGLGKTRGLFYQFGRKDPFPAASVGLYNGSGTAVTAFTATGGDCIVRVQGKTEIKTAVQYPYNFYVSGGGNWVSGDLYGNNSWSNPGWYTSVPKAGKSLFDPCPPGWRLPVTGTWDTFALADGVPNAANYPGDYRLGNDQAGWEFYIAGSSGETAFYPATGVRYFTSGTVLNERQDGYNWSATPLSGGLAYYLSCYPNSLIPQNNAHRGYGFSTRCIQE
jgi:hypothetical protein